MKLGASAALELVVWLEDKVHVLLLAAGFVCNERSYTGNDRMSQTM